MDIFDNANQPFRDPAALFILQKIASGLRQQGYEVTDPRHGKASDAIFGCKFKNFDITVVINLESRQEDIVKGRLLTWRGRRPLLARLGRAEPTSIEVKEQLGELCSAIDLQLRQITGAGFVLWLTRSEAEHDWSQRVRSGPSARSHKL